MVDMEVQWGKFLRVHVRIDVSRKLIRGKKINIDKGVARWVLFKYECLPNFCYRCGLLEHDLKDCSLKEEIDKNGEMGELQYGAWIRGELVRRSGCEPTYLKKNEGVGKHGWIPDDNN